MPFFGGLFVVFWGLLTALPATAQMLTASEYGYPLANPFEATIAGTPSALQADMPDDESILQQDFSLRLHPEREYSLPANFWPVKSLSYRLAHQPHPAPLIFIIAGTGAHYSNRHAENLKRVLYAAGYHVIQLSSPTSYDFMAAASWLATPGISSVDAKDLYQVMRAIMQKHAQLPVTHYALAGYSLGGLHAAFVSQLDDQLGYFNFQRVLMINPPVNLYGASQNLDRLVQVKLDSGQGETSFYELLLSKLTHYFRSKGYIDLDEALLYDFQRSDYRLTNEQMAMVIGAVFRLSVADIAFTSDLINHRGLITPPDFPIGTHTPLEPFFKRALLCNFECYIHQQVLPVWARLDPQGSLQSLAHHVSLRALESYLQQNDKIRALHNADDLILSPGDLGFLRKVLGQRLTVYPRGGHCGNMTYTVNVRQMLEYLGD